VEEVAQVLSLRAESACRRGVTVQPLANVVAESVVPNYGAMVTK
jgi:hypothetical protein